MMEVVGIVLGSMFLGTMAGVAVAWGTNRVCRFIVETMEEG